MGESRRESRESDGIPKPQRNLFGTKKLVESRVPQRLESLFNINLNENPMFAPEASFLYKEPTNKNNFNAVMKSAGSMLYETLKCKIRLKEKEKAREVAFVDTAQNSDRSKIVGVYGHMAIILGMRVHSRCCQCA